MTIHFPRVPLPPSVGQLGGWGGEVNLSAPSQLVAGILRNNLAIPIGWLAIGCNLDWVTQFHGSSGITVNSPKWLIWVTNISSWVTNIVSRYHEPICTLSLQYQDKRYAGYGDRYLHRLPAAWACLLVYKIKLRSPQGKVD